MVHYSLASAQLSFQAYKCKFAGDGSGRDGED